LTFHLAHLNAYSRADTISQTVIKYSYLILRKVGFQLGDNKTVYWNTILNFFQCRPEISVRMLQFAHVQAVVLLTTKPPLALLFWLLQRKTKTLLIPTWLSLSPLGST